MRVHVRVAVPHQHRDPIAHAFHAWARDLNVNDIEGETWHHGVFFSRLDAVVEFPNALLARAFALTFVTPVDDHGGNLWMGIEGGTLARIDRWETPEPW